MKELEVSGIPVSGCIFLIQEQRDTTRQNHCRSGAPVFTSGENYQPSPNQCNLGLARRRGYSEISLKSMFKLTCPPREKEGEKRRKEKYKPHILPATSRSLAFHYLPDDGFTWHTKLHSLLGVEQLQTYCMKPGKH